MTIYEVLGMFFTLYFAAIGIAAHLYVLRHGARRIRHRNEAGRLHEHEAEKMLADVRFPAVR